VLENIEDAVEVLTNLEGIRFFSGRFASTFTTDVKKDRASLVVPIIVVHPVPHLEGRFFLEVEVIQLLCKGKILEIVRYHLVIGRGSTE
jgi:hypothetical protein